MTLSAGSLGVAALFFIEQAASHMIMQHPVPFGLDILNNSPLVNAKPGSAGSDFPCKQRPGVYDIGTMNDMAVETPVMLNFTGSASHGGGTCQIAVSPDKEPKVESVWKIIQVFEGGCPTAQDGNSGSTDFSFQIPKDFPNGQFTLSWTWYNKIGNREVYQNCAPIKVTGGSESNDVYNSLPSLYLINLPTSECSPVETTDLEIPDPGQNVLKDSSVLKGATGPSCAASAAAQTAGTSGYQTGSPHGSDSSSQTPPYTVPAYGGGVSSASSNDGSYAAPTTMVTVVTSSEIASRSTIAAGMPSFPTLTPSLGAGISGPGSATGSAAASVGTGSPPSYGNGSSGTSSLSSSPSASQASVYAGIPAASVVPDSGDAGGSDLTASVLGGTTCTSEGAIVCNGSTQFGLCNNGRIAWQDVAAGTTCSDRQIQKRSMGRHAHASHHAKNAYRHF